MARELMARIRPSTLYREGLDSAGWYDDTRRAFQARLGDDADTFLAFLAATSPRANLRANVTKARKAFANFKATGNPIYGGALPAHVGNLRRAANGEALQGPKVQPFLAALLGDSNAVPIDVWMARAYGFGDRLTLAQTKEIQRRIRNLASHVGDEPRRVQAAIWVAYKRRVSPSTTVANYETIYDAQQEPTLGL